MSKKTLAIIFGGQSSEHEVSCRSAVTIIGGVDTERYELLLIGITKAGKWLRASDVADITAGTWYDSDTSAVILPDAGVHGALITKADGTVSTVHIDLAWPVLHGLNGEDGTIQGLLTLAQIPYVGDGVLASAVGMDKYYTKIVVDDLGINQAKCVMIRAEELKDMAAVAAKVAAKLDYPVFVKPSQAGSSCGVSRVAEPGELPEALKIAAAEDDKILVEGEVKGRELECAVLRKEGHTVASGVGEILAAETFYSYDAKYNNADSKTVVGPELPEGKAEEIRSAAVRIFDAIGGKSLARVDFFMEQGSNRIVFNEINTMPGFTSISMYPMLWAGAGKDIRQLVEELISTAAIR